MLAASRTWVLAACLCACGSTSSAEPPEAKRSQPERATAPKASEPAKPQPSPAPAPTQPAAATDVEAALRYDPADPLGDLEAADALDAMGRGKLDANAKAPTHGCAVIDGGRRVWQQAGPSTIAAMSSGFVVAGYAVRAGREQLFVVHLAEGELPEPITAFDITPAHRQPRVAPPGLTAQDESELAIAYTDGQGRLFARRLRLARAGGGAPVEVGTEVDTRFAPAVVQHHDATLVAWTRGSTPMHAMLAVLVDDSVRARHDLTPIAMGSAAPVFVAGATPPVIAMFDARSGISTILRVDIGQDATPEAAVVVRPVGMSSTPPELAAASSASTTYVAFAGVGAAATSAVGVVDLAKLADKPQALVKGTGYGPLHLSATNAPNAVLIAADAPTSAAKDAPREVRVHVVDARGIGPAAVLRAAGGATHAAIARTQRGEVAVAFTGSSGVYVARLRCDDGT